MENGGKDSPQLTHVNVMPASEALQTEKMAHFLPDSAAAAAAAVGAAKAKSQVRRRRRCCSVAPAQYQHLDLFRIGAAHCTSTFLRMQYRCLGGHSMQVKLLQTRKWLAINAKGEVRHLELAKLRVTAGLGVQLRDLR